MTESGESEPRGAGTFRVLLLGTFVLERDARPIDTTLWQRRVASLFKLLATASGYRRQRDELIEALWPEADPESGAGNLRTVAHRLRAALGGGSPLPVLAEHGWISLNPAYRWEIDLDTFEQLVAAAGDDPVALRRALALYRGEPLVDDRYEDWAIALRDRLQSLWRDASLRLATLHQRDGEVDDAIRLFERMLEVDPIDEEALRALLTALYRSGRPADALRRYHQFEHVLAQELGVPPAPETMAVLQELHAQTAVPITAERGDHRALPIGGFLGAIPEGPIVGREDELTQVLFAADMVAAGTGQVLLLGGEAGVGKTRLAQEVMLHLHARGFVVGTGRCYEREQDVPLYPVFEAMERTYEAYPAIGRHAMRPDAPGAPPADSQAGGWTEGEARSELQAVGALQISVPTVALEPHEKHALFRQITSFFQTVAENKPLAVLLDDLQWADQGSLDLLRHVAAQTRGHRVLLLATHSDDASPENPVGRLTRELVRDGLVDRIRLQRLGPEATTALVRAAVGETAALEEFAEFVHRRARGNPFYIRRMLEAVGGRYSLIRHIGSGGMGRVFEAIDTETGDLVAVKIMFDRAEVDARAVRRFEREGATLARLKHPNIVTVYGTFLTEHVNSIAMELLDGKSLAALMEDGQPSLARIKTIMAQVAAALASAHERGIVHCDIKPANIMVLPGDRVKLTDFGIARLVRERGASNSVTTTGMTLGTPLYMAPEQVEGRPLDGRADIYAVGAVLYQLVTGRPPLEGRDALSLISQRAGRSPEPPERFHAALPHDWSDLILKALANDPAERFQTAAEMEEAIGALRDSARSPSREDAAVPTGPVLDMIPAHDAVGVDSTAPVLSGEQPGRQARGVSQRRSVQLVTAAVAGLAAVVVAVVLPPHLVTHAGAHFRVVGAGAVSGLQLKQPSGVTLGVGGRIYVSDSGNDRVTEIDSQGRQRVVWGAPPTGLGSLFRPHDVAVGTTGNVYVADYLHDRVQEFKPDGTPLRQWGTSGRENDQFVRPTGLGLDSAGRVYVADSLNARIQIFSPSGTFKHAWPVPGPTDADRSHPSDVAVDAAGYMYVVDYQYDRIVKLSPAGAVVRRWGGPGAGPGQFRKPASIALDSRGDMYVADQMNDRVQELSPKGSYITSWGEPGSGPGQLEAPTGLALNRAGDIYVTDSGNNRIQEIDPKRGVIRTWGTKGSGPGQLNNPQGLAVDRFGNVLVADAWNDVIREFTPSGKQIGQVGVLDAMRLSDPQGISFSRGVLYVVDSGNSRVDVIDSPGAVPSALTSAELSDPAAVDADRGIVFVADMGNGVVRVNAATERLVGVWPQATTRDGQVVRPGGIAVGRNGNVLVSDPSHNQLVRFSPSGRRLGVLGAGVGLKDPAGVEIDGEGHVYVADTGNDRVVELLASGRILATWGSAGSALGHFQRPAALAVDSQGHVFVADSGNNRVQEILPAG